MDEFNRRLAGVEAYIHDVRKIHVEYVELLSALMEAVGEPDPETLCRMGHSTGDLIRILGGHPFKAPRILGTLADGSIRAPGSLRRVYASLGRPEASEWEILSNAQDPFPSDPCAHNEADDVVLDLSTGGLFHDRAPVYRIRRAELIRFRGKIAEKYPGIVLPPLAG